MIYVVIPVYNHAEALKECLSSLYEQTLKPEHVVVVDDGSFRDDPEPIVKQWTDRLPVTFVRKENGGAPSARNRGYSEIKKFLKSSEDADRTIIFCDADVRMNKDCLEKMKNALLDNPNASYAYSSFMFGPKEFECGKFDAKRLKQMPYITTTSLIRFEDFPGFDESLKKFQDWDLWLQLLQKGKRGVWVPEVLFSVKPRGLDGMSVWLPSFLHKLPWPIFGYIPKQIKKYRAGRAIIAQKHGIIDP